MRAEKTRHLIEAALSQILNVDNHLKSKAVMFAHKLSALRELEELERKAEIADALEWAINEDYKITQCIYDGECIYSIDALLERYRGTQ